MKKITLILLLVLNIVTVRAQNKVYAFQEAAKHGISTKHLDSIYQSAVHSDMSKAVFKTEVEQEKMENAYKTLLQDLDAFLKKNNFNWEHTTKIFNRIYFNIDGTIDYYLYSFLGKDEDKPGTDSRKEFDRLLNLFAQQYKLSISAPVKFAQSSPATFQPM